MITSEYQKRYDRENRVSINSRRVERYNEQKISGVTYYQRNKESIALKRSEFYRNNRQVLLERLKTWKKLNPEKAAAQRRRWRTSDHGHADTVRRIRERMVMKDMSIPTWSDRNKISSIYLQARKSKLTVDHIIPIKHPLVCGLHVETNLQLLSKSENSRKQNRWNFEIPLQARAS